MSIYVLASLSYGGSWTIRVRPRVLRNTWRGLAAPVAWAGGAYGDDGVGGVASDAR